MIRRLKLAGIMLGALAVLVVAVMAYQSYNLATNYTLVEARITSVDIDCFIKDGREKMVAKGTKKLAYMDCAIAPEVASLNGFKEKAVKQRAKIAYDYRSPVDSRHYKGSYVRDGEVEGYRVGKTIKVHAHKTQPSKSKTTSGNLFMADTGV